MLNKCVVQSCQRRNDLFFSPLDPVQLQKWKKILEIEIDDFSICDCHFEECFLTKVLREDAVPTIFIVPRAVGECCECCRKAAIEGALMENHFIYVLEELFNIKVNFNVSLNFKRALYKTSGYPIIYNFSCQIPD